MSTSIAVARLEQSSVPFEDTSIVCSSDKKSRIPCMVPVQTVHLVGKSVYIPDVGKSSVVFVFVQK